MHRIDASWLQGKGHLTVFFIQEYTRAYNAYSAALQLSPVGPSSHVFLSNRAAALLSLKRYNAAATDARRAVALAPTFGKAHARLGQALYFLKDYAGAVAAYEDAIRYEPDNQVTKTYLEKAKFKLEKHRRTGEEVMSIGSTSTAMHYTPSVVTDPMRSGLVGSYYQGNNTALTNAAMKSPKNISPSPLSSKSGPLDDPDFEEALRIQARANQYLAAKEYKAAIEEYTAALFLVPDDVVLSSNLHLGRAHALNGSRRHERAKNDALLAIRLQPSPAAYSTLAKSLFYMKDYRGSIDAFQKCIEILPPGESLGMFDKAYLQKAEAALEEEEASLLQAGMVSPKSASSVPKLPPPRFVPREEALASTPNLPPMPREWPQQSPGSPSFKCGLERDVICLSESLGVKLNRGADGVVRVLWVAPSDASSPVARQGKLQVGDIVREAAGVDLRRPITNVMWGDTVALIKMAPRPITLVVAKELSEVPTAVLDEIRKANDGVVSPSASSGDEAVRTQQYVSPETTTAAAETSNADDVLVASTAEETQEPILRDSSEPVGGDEETDGGEEEGLAVVESVNGPTEIESNADSVGSTDNEVIDIKDQNVVGMTKNADAAYGDVRPALADNALHALENEESIADGQTSQGVLPVDDDSPLFLHTEEDRLIGGEVLFERSQPAAYSGWDNLRWLSYSGARKVRFCQPCFRLVETEKKKLLWSKIERSYHKRLLAIYEEPRLIMILRRPTGIDEVQNILGLPGIAELDESETSVECNWIVESIAEPGMCKLRLSALTTASSVPPDDTDDRRKSCMELITPAESILLSTAQVRSEARKAEQSFRDSGAFLETSATELQLKFALCADLDLSSDTTVHQTILGTLHAIVLSGNLKCLEESMDVLRAKAENNTGASHGPDVLLKRIINEVDDNGMPPLYYACYHRMNQAATMLIAAGALVGSARYGPQGQTLLHVCARNLDHVTLSSLLSVESDPHALDQSFRTPMYVAATEGRLVTGTGDSDALGKCLAALRAWGGQFIAGEASTRLVHPIGLLAAEWSAEEIRVVLSHSSYRFPLSSVQEDSPSLSATYSYPVHRALLSLSVLDSSESVSALPDGLLIQTLRVLLEHGFEPNERLEASTDGGLASIGGFTPLQVLQYVGLVAQGKGFADQAPERYSEAAKLLVGSGARLAVDFPPRERLRRRDPKTGVQHDPDYFDESKVQVLIGASKKQLFAVLGGEESLKQAEKHWTKLGSVQVTQLMNLQREDSSLQDSDAPGGSSDKSCAICWQAFGSLVARKHRCRASRRYICDACSIKRVVVDGVDFRVSDGQYLLASVDAAKEEARHTLAAMEHDRAVALAAKEARSQIRQKRLQKEEESNRQSLFQQMFGEAQNTEKPKASPADTVSNLSASLNETRNALNERGVKLVNLGDKSRDMVDASADFARMAKELRKKSEKGLFW